ncbi:flagellar assembly protein A [Fictibacillus aquaticus]|uniref:RNA-binding protein KhpB N-terminal domain-containing protein n=1 Tax=Fictibacillus aquaticus TaxID=2021314 RepID=A0A235FES4_9BACL|nr:flagellar assembly protein A [Fictibacillus aquaticus]OYD59712.1 hypothetical protein CGZ90_07480 [Fictibacillus aquaticus]
MANSIISKGSTVDEAVTNGLQLLNTNVEEVSIEILEAGKKGILGLRMRPVIVKLTFIEEKTTSSQSDSLMQEAEKDASLVDYKSCAWVSDGKVNVKERAVVVPCEGIEFYVNDVITNKQAEVNDTDAISVIISPVIQHASCSVSIDRTGMSAYLNIQPGYTGYFQLEDAAPAAYLQLKTVEAKRDYQFVSIQEIVKRMEAAGITYGIHYDVVREAVQSTDGGTFVIAEGVPSVPGKNGEFHYHINMKGRTLSPAERKDGSVDFRESFYVPSVSPGQVVADYIPAVSGKNGKNVYGEDLPAPPVYELEISCDHGMMLAEPQKSLIATEHGRPLLKQKGKKVTASIVKKLKIKDDVDLAQGNIRFIGDVELMKNVKEHMVVHAEGDVVLHGNADHAEIIAGQTVYLHKSSINSKITAGKGSDLSSELNLLLDEICAILNAVYSAIKQIHGAAATKTSSEFANVSIGRLIDRVIEQKYKDLIPLMRTFTDKIQNQQNALQEGWFELAVQFQIRFLILQKEEFSSLENFSQLLQKAEDTRQNRQDVIDPNVCIHAAYAVNSELYSSGDITIHEKGIYNCKVHAYGKAEINGYMRGGELYAAGGAVIKETGSAGGVKTFVHVPAEASIRIEKVMEGTVIKVGCIIHRFNDETAQIYARLDENSQLVLY